jgi:tRNA(Ile)-lysidine synthase
MAPLDPLPEVAVGCSGGPDSLALTLLADDWARARGGRALALIADHGLRPESAAEAAGTLALLRARGIAARVLPLGLEPGPRLQERAREARRAALLAACREAGIPQLLLGHHAADQAETVLLRALRGSGPAGLAGMAPAVAFPEAVVFRPLLGVPPERLRATLAARGVEAVADPSNGDARFARARLRGGGTLGALAAAGAFAARRATAEAVVAQRLAHAARLLPEGCARLDLPALGTDEVAVDALAALIRAVAAPAYPPARDATRALLRRGHGTLGGAALLRGGRWLVREAAAVAPPLRAVTGAVWDRRWRLRVGNEDFTLAALGPNRLREHAPELPAAALASLPALWKQGEAVLVPSLAYPSAEACAKFPLDYLPASGPAAP